MKTSLIIIITFIVIFELVKLIIFAVKKIKASIELKSRPDALCGTVTKERIYFRKTVQMPKI